MIRRFLVVLFVLIAHFAIAGIGDIRNVTVFMDGALVTRAQTIETRAGSNSAIFTGLTGDLDEDTIRAEFEDSPRARIISVDLEEIIRAELVRDDERRLNAEVRRIEDELRVLDDRIKVAQLRLDFIAGIGKQTSVTVKTDLERGEMKPSSWQEAWQTLEGGTSEALRTVHQTQIEKRSLHAELGKVKRELSRVKSGTRDQYRAHVHFESAVSGTVSVLLSYMIDDADWQPVYDAYLDSKSNELTIALAAEVEQNSGEDWSDIRLTVSTAYASEDATLPDLDPWWIDFSTTRTASKEAPGFASGVNVMPSGSAADNLYFAEEISLSGSSIVADSEYASEYQVSARTSVPADGESHRMRIVEHRLPAEVSITVLPRLERNAYVIATATYDGQVPLMPGDVLLYLDGAYKGMGEMPRVRPGGVAKLGFGIDHKVLVKYSEDAEQRSTSGVVSKKRRIERWTEASVLNSHNKSIDITILDHMPVAKDELIKIEILEGSTIPTETDVDKTPGLLAWKKTLDAKEEMKVRFGFTVSFPKDRTTSGL